MKNILVPTDFSACASNATQAAIDLASSTKARLHFFTKVSPSTHASNAGVSAQERQHEVTQQIHNAKVLLQEWVDTATKRGVDCTTYVEAGKLLPLMERYVEQEAIDFVVMGSHGASGKQEYFLGSNTQRVVRKLRRTVLIIKEDVSNYQLRRVIFASNFDAREMSAFRYFLDFVRPFRPEIHLVQIDTSSWFSQPRILVRSAMNDFQEACGDLVSHQHFFRDWSVDAGIRSLAQQVDAQMIGISNQYQHPLKRLISGSNVEALVNHAQVPILSIVVPEEG